MKNSTHIAFAIPVGEAVLPTPLCDQFGDVDSEVGQVFDETNDVPDINFLDNYVEAKDTITKAGKALGSDIGKAALGGAAILGTAALASKALSRKNEKPIKKTYNSSGMSEQVTFQQFQEKCWAGYEKKGMKTMFGKRYPNCVKKKK